MEWLKAFLIFPWSCHKISDRCHICHCKMNVLAGRTDYRNLHTSCKEILKELFITTNGTICICKCTFCLQSLTNSLECLLLSKDQSHRTIIPENTGIPYCRTMHISIGSDEIIIFMGSVNDSRIEISSIDNFDTIHKTLSIKSSLSRGRSKISLLPTRMVMHHKSTLSLGITHCLHRIRIENSIIVSCKEGIEMSHLCSVTGDFDTGDDKQTMTCTFLLSHLNRIIKIHHDAILIQRLCTDLIIDSLLILPAIVLLGIFHEPILPRSILEVLGNSHYIQTVHPCFICTEIRSHLTI